MTYPSSNASAITPCTCHPLQLSTPNFLTVFLISYLTICYCHLLVDKAESEEPDSTISVAHGSLGVLGYK